MVFSHLDNQGAPAAGHAVGIEGSSLFRSFGYDYEKGYHAYIYRSPGGIDIARNNLVVANFEEDIFWSRRTTNVGNFFGPLGITADHVFYYQNSISNGTGGADLPPFIGIGCSQIEDGQILWNKTYTPIYTPDPDGLYPLEISPDNDGNISILGYMPGASPFALRFIVKMDISARIGGRRRGI